MNAYSPDTVLEDFLRTAESESDSSKASTSEFDGSKNQRSGWRWTGFFELFTSKSKGHMTKDPLISSLKLSKRFSRSMRETSSGVMPNSILDNGFTYFKPQWKLFTLSQLQTATNNFHQGWFVHLLEILIHLKSLYPFVKCNDDIVVVKF